ASMWWCQKTGIRRRAERRRARGFIAMGKVYADGKRRRSVGVKECKSARVEGCKSRRNIRARGGWGGAAIPPLRNGKRRRCSVGMTAPLVRRGVSGGRRGTEERPKSQAHTPCLGHPAFRG